MRWTVEWSRQSSGTTSEILYSVDGTKLALMNGSVSCAVVAEVAGRESGDLYVEWAYLLPIWKLVGE